MGWPKNQGPGILHPQPRNFSLSGQAAKSDLAAHFLVSRTQLTAQELMEVLHAVFRR